jgi:hypothetical protein
MHRHDEKVMMHKEFWLFEEQSDPELLNSNPLNDL